MVHRTRGPFRFDDATRQDLRSRFGNETLIADLEEEVNRYLMRVGESGLPISGDLKRIHAASVRLARAIRTSHASLQYLRGFAHPLELEIQGHTHHRKGRPPDAARRRLEHGVGWVLHRHGVMLTIYRDGKLADALKWVLYAATGKSPQDSLGICRRVVSGTKMEAASRLAQAAASQSWAVRPARRLSEPHDRALLDRYAKRSHASK